MKTTRRSMLKSALGTMAVSALPKAKVFAAPVKEAGSGLGRFSPTKFAPLPLGEIKPAGWLLRQLRLQADGLGGHLDEFWADVGPNSGWLGGTGESWERGPYFLDGLLPLAYLLDDDVLKAKAMRFVEWTLTHQAPSGMIGPASNDDWWPRMVMVKALAQYQEVSGDARVIPLLTRYFHYQLQELPTRPLKSWGRFRWQDEAMMVQWLYDRTSDPKLLALCALLKQQGFDWTASFANFNLIEPITREVIAKYPEGTEANEEFAMRAHGVNNGQAVKVAAVEYRMNGDPQARADFDRQLGALDKFHGEPNGMFSCDEHLAGRDPSHGTELCTVVETMFSLETVLTAFGDPLVGDRLEKIAYNALPGTFTDDMWAHQYNQQPNQVQVGLNSKPWTTDGPESNLYGLEPNFGCCTANFHQGWPKLTASLWMRSGDHGLVAAVYAPCMVKTEVRGVPVRLREETEYPFRETISIAVEPAKSVAFPLLLRIPAWAQGATVMVNGQAVSAAVQAGSFARVERTWMPGDVVQLRLPMKPRLSRGFHNALTVERGPLVFSHSPGESWVKLRDHGMTADWQVYPTGDWSYALALDEAGAGAIATTERPVPARPFTADPAAVELRVKGRQLLTWRSEDGVANPVPVSPVKSAEPETTLTLVPYAAAKLRITAFPQLSEDAEAKPKPSV